ncbi:putative non-specific serine/threonine protein kinase [Helianthus anomalus]
MGNTCRGSFGIKDTQGLNKPEDRSISTQNHSSALSNNSLDYSPNTLISQQLIAQEFSKDPPNPNSNSKPPPVPKKDNSMSRHGTSNQSYYVLGHRTENIRDVYTLDCDWCGLCL